MAQPRFVHRLSEASVPLDSILLDPNNPRLIGLDGFEGVEERRIAEKSIQENTHNKLNSVRAIDQESLSASIEKSGLLGVDRVVIRPIPDKDEGGNALFVVVEGNRRIAACKTLLLQHKSGEKTLKGRSGTCLSRLPGRGRARQVRVARSVPPKRPAPVRDDLVGQYRDHAGAQHVQVWAVTQQLDRHLHHRGRIPRRTPHQKLDVVAGKRD
jgi:hypothetical protein